MSKGVHNLLARLNAFVWDDDLRELSGLRRYLVFVSRVLQLLVKELIGGQLNLRAMSLVYTTLLSIVPLLAVSFSVLKGFGVHNRIEPLLYNLLEPLGPNGVEITDRIIGFVENVKVGVLGSIGVVLLIYTVIALLQKIESAFNFVWQVDHLRSLSQRVSNYLSVTLVGPLLIFSAIGFTASVLDTEAAQHIASIEPFGSLMFYGSKLVPYVLVCLAFTLIYIFIPNTRVQFTAALVGGVIAGVIWKITGWGFAAFIASSSKYAAIVQHPKYMTLHREPIVLSNRMRERLALQVMFLTGYNYYHDKEPWTLDRLVEYLDLPGEPVHRTVRVLVDAGYLIEIDNEDMPVYLPLRDIENVRLVDVLTDIRSSHESRVLGLQQLTAVRAVDQLMSELNIAQQTALGERTLRSMVQAVDEELEAGMQKLVVIQAD
jgi:membrane protein